MTVSAILTAPTGTFNITQYLDVNAGKGMDPADPQFTNKIFAHSLLKQGGTLALEDLKLRELTYPLILKAASKDELTLIVREINKIINSAGCELEWKDEGSNTTTLFVLASGQCDPEFDFRMGQQSAPMLKAKLRLFVQPLATKERNPRSLLIGGTAAANGATVRGETPLTLFGGGSAILGDAPALVKTTIYAPPVAWQIAAVSVLPASGYIPGLGATAARLPTKTPLTRVATTNAMGGALLAVKGGTIAHLEWPLASATLYAGPQRMFLLAKASPVNLTSIYAEWYGWGNTKTSTVRPQNASVWGLIDMGVINVPSAAIVENSGAFPLYLSISKASTAFFDLGGVILLPEGSTTYLNEYLATETSTTTPERLTFDGTTGRVTSGQPPSGGEESASLFDITGYARGALANADVENGAPVIAVLTMPALGGPVGSPLNITVNVLERTRYVF